MDRTIDKDLLTKLASQLSANEATLESLTLCEHDPRSFASFVQMLPTNAPAESGKLIYSLVKELAILEVKPYQKLTLLNEVKAQALQCSAKLARTSLSKETANTISLSQAILKHLASGYRSVVKAFALGDQAGTAMPQIAQSVSQSLHVQGVLYLKCLQFYLGTPPRFWADLHTEYKIATLCRVTDNPNPGRERSSTPSITIHNEYLRILLLACSGPNRLSANDLAATYEALAEWAQLTDVVSGMSPGLFVVDSESDLPPVYASKLEGSNRRYYKIHISKLTDNLQQKLDNFTTASVIDKVPPRLIRTLIANWTTEQKRLEQRQEEDSEVQLIYGLSHIHETLTGNADFDSYLDSLSAIVKRETKPESQTLEFQRSELFRNDVWSEALDTEGGGSFPVRQETLDAEVSDKAPSKETENKPPPLHALVRDRSPNGKCVELDPGKSPKLAPGEIVATRDSDSDQWAPGIVRWKRTTAALTVMLGIELLGGTVHTRAARAMRSGKAPGPYLPALMITDSDGSAQLITPTMSFKNGDQVHLLGGDSGTMINLSTPLDTTGFIGRFALHTPTE